VHIGRSVALGAALFAASIAASCRSVPLAPVRADEVTPAAPSPALPDDRVTASGVHTPVIRGIRGDVRNDTLFLRAQFDPLAARLRRPYDPNHAGGWILQLFMNTDQAPTGYPWMGIDYIVRGGEILPDGRLIVRHVEPGDDSPGGWGPVSGSARLSQWPQVFTLAVPLAAIGGDDGSLDFVLETYSIVDCPECDGGVTAAWAGDFFGSTSRRLSPGALMAPTVAWLSRDDAARSGRFAALIAATRHRDDTAR
jgi:hypothetical protein